jgi:hypothetical protein
MAQIQVTQTGDRIETRIRGRVFRYAPVAPRSKERRRVCVLSSWAGAMIERWGVEQPCHGPKCTHTHQSRDAVNALVKDGVLRFIPGSESNVATYTYGRTWKGIASGGPLGPKVMQLV